MFDEQTPEIHEVEYPDENRHEGLNTAGDENTEQIVSSWFDDAPAEEAVIQPDPNLPVDVEVPTQDVAPATDMTLTSTTDPTAPAPELTPQQSVQQVPTTEQGPAPLFDLDMSGWCDQSTPEDWVDWDAPVDPSQDSWTDDGYSTDWGQVEATWPEEGGDLWTAQTPETQLADMVGPGHVADEYWGYQGQTNYCVLYSAASILGEVYGHEIDMNEMVSRADANGWLVYDNAGQVLGVNPENFDDLLASYGVPSHNLEGEQGAWDSLNTALTNNQRVIVSVDSKELDLGANQGTDNDADHAVAVTGIDYSRNVVIVNDSARSAGLEIPMQVFVDAWRDGNFHLTVTDSSLGAGEGAVPPPGTSGLQPDAPGFAVLPFTLHLPDSAPTIPEPRVA